MLKSRLVLLGSAIAAAVLAVGLLPSGGHVGAQTLGVRPIANPIIGGTVAFNPSSNPAFKVNGFTSCAPGRTGHVWVNAHISAVTVPSSSTDELDVIFPGGTTIVLSAYDNPAWENDLTTAINLSCSAISGSNLLYSVRSMSGGTVQAVNSGNKYPITLVD